VLGVHPCSVGRRSASLKEKKITKKGPVLENRPLGRWARSGLVPGDVLGFRARC